MDTLIGGNRLSSYLMGNTNTFAKRSLRLLEFLERNGRSTVQKFDHAARETMLLKSLSSKKEHLCSKKGLDELSRLDLVELASNQIVLRETGRKRLKRMEAASEPYQSQHRSLAKRRVLVDEVWSDVVENIDESPLSRLRYRKSRSGQPYLSERAYLAGERLRHDFTRGSYQKSISFNWELSGASRAKSRGLPATADMSETVLDARSRIDQVVAVLGADLTGVTMDVCCYLKGLEEIERDRKWPPRSAKLMLRTGLEMLASHYQNS